MRLGPKVGDGGGGFGFGRGVGFGRGGGGGGGNGFEDFGGLQRPSVMSRVVVDQERWDSKIFIDSGSYYENKSLCTLPTHRMTEKRWCFETINTTSTPVKQILVYTKLSATRGGYPALLGSETFPVPAPVSVFISRSRRFSRLKKNRFLK
jgi:hypothetical protein